MKPLYFLLFAALIAPIASPKVTARPSDHHQPLVAVVSTTRDSGRGSLRAAIESASRNAGTRIIFQIPSTDKNFVGTNAVDASWQIFPLTPLPPIVKPDTQIEGDGRIVVSADGAKSGKVALRVEAPRCQIKGMVWKVWANEAISIHTTHTLITANTFEDVPCGIVVRGPQSRSNRFERNTFERVSKPIALQNGANAAMAAPTLTIVRDDAVAPVSHRFTLKFNGKAKTNVTLELNYSPDEAREKPKIQRVRDTRTLKTDDNGNAVWQFNWKGYPAGSWTATATQNNNTSEFSNTVIMPYL